ncbi:MAG: LysR family transcriptional regulator [Gemmatimonadetes bacterium]|nr:LysR family transcriptional regulator [Gemmatimonadota bacterium]
MHLETLRLYCDVVRLRSYSRAAEQNHVSQSAASQAIGKLEEELGAALIDRTQRPFVVTPQGQSFHEACLGLLGAWERAKAAVGAAEARIDGTVRLAAIYSVGVYEVSRYLQEFASAYPAATVQLECLHSHKVVEAVLGGEADVGILSFPPNDRELVVIDLPAETMVFVCDPNHRLARRKTIKPSDLNGEGFVAFEPALMIRKAIDRTLRHQGVQVQTVLEFDNIDTIKQAVAGGQGVSILPRPTIQAEVELGTLVAIPIAIPDLVRPLGIIRARHRALTPTVERFIEVVRGSGAMKPAKRTRSRGRAR